MKKIKFLLVSLLVMLMVAGCGQSTEAPKADPAKETAKQNQSIKLGGSSTLAPTVAKCADDFTEKYKTWNKVDPQLPEEPIVIFVSTGGSGFGVKAALDGTVDVGLVSREIKDEEKAKMPNGKIFKMGSDALAIAVNPKNPVVQVKPNLTTEEVKRIFAGEVKTWKDLDATLPDRSTVLAIRDLGGGAAQVFDELVMKKTPVAKEAIQLPSMGALAGKVAENADAIGYVSTGLIKQNEGKIAALDIDGVTPTNEKIASGEYKIARPLLLITKEQPDQKQQLFLDYLLSEDGLKVVEDMGFVPVVK